MLLQKKPKIFLTLHLIWLSGQIEKRADPHTKEIPHGIQAASSNTGIAASTQNDQFSDDIPVDRSNRFTSLSSASTTSLSF